MVGFRFKKHMWLVVCGRVKYYRVVFWVGGGDSQFILI